ncbi:hypothetical protein XENTR_v10020709 [Xenopus tropicalis]|nr:hypothetical protein XENTR_v10020709 [Xenopus tropicalis]
MLGSILSSGTQQYLFFGKNLSLDLLNNSSAGLPLLCQFCEKTAQVVDKTAEELRKRTLLSAIHLHPHKWITKHLYTPPRVRALAL